MSTAPRSGWKDPMIASTIVIALATIANVFISTFLWRTTNESVKAARDSVEVTQRIYKASNRPYIGISSATMNKDAKNKTLNYELEIKNFGTVTATNASFDVKTFINDQIQPQTYFPDSGNTSLAPTGSANIGDTISTSGYKAIVDNGAVLRIKIQVNYYGVSEDLHTFYHEYKYDVSTDSFINMRSSSN
jgi:hypothetical protein